MNSESLLMFLTIVSVCSQDITCKPSIYASMLKTWLLIYFQHRQLGHLGASGFRVVAAAVMKAIIAPTVQRLYSLHGKKGKRAFLMTRLCKVATGEFYFANFLFQRLLLVTALWQDALLLRRRHGLVQPTLQFTLDPTHQLPLPLPPNSSKPTHMLYILFPRPQKLISTMCSVNRTT